MKMVSRVSHCTATIERFAAVCDLQRPGHSDWRFVCTGRLVRREFSQGVVPATQSSSNGRSMDVTLSTCTNPQLAQGTHGVPAGLQLGLQPNLMAPPGARAAPPDRDDIVEYPQEKPKGRILLY